MEYLQLLIDNGDNILASIGALFAAITGILTIVQKFMPDKISNKALIALEAVSSRFSLGTKKAEIIKK